METTLMSMLASLVMKKLIKPLNLH